jgi:hypothetical protein
MLAQKRRVIFIIIQACWFLTACSPEYNWRTVSNTAWGYTATFPDKPVQVSRTLSLIGLQVPLTLHATRVNNLYFAVGTVPMIGNLEGQGTALRNALAQALINNIGGGQAILKPIQWLGKPAQVMFAKGTLPNGLEAFVEARFFEHQGLLYEVLVMGAAKKSTPDILTSWFGGFSLLLGR